MRYTLTLTSEQAKVMDKAVELLLRLKLGQYKELAFALMDIGDEGFAEKRDEAAPHLLYAFQTMSGRMFPGWDKDEEWFRLYDLHQVVRHAIHDAEHPGTIGVDSYPPVFTAGEKPPQIKVIDD